MVNVESSPVPTCNSKQDPVATGLMLSPSSMIVHESPVIKVSASLSRVCIVVSFGESVGIRTRRIVGSAYAPPTFCIDHVCELSFISKIPAHSNAPSPCPSCPSSPWSSCPSSPWSSCPSSPWSSCPEWSSCPSSPWSP